MMKSPLVMPGIIIGGLTLLALLHYYPCDDAYISFRYALNWAQGKGLVWNEGERVEGYSNFLWTILIGLGIKVGITPEAFTSLLGTTFFFILLLSVYRLSLHSFKGETSPALWAVLIVGLNHSLWAFARSGLETVPFAALALGMLSRLLKGRENPAQKSSWTALSLLITLAPLLRPDGAILSLWGILNSLPFSYHRFIGASAGMRRKPLLWLLFIPAMVWIGYGVWKLSYYNALLPGSFHSKVQGLTGIGFGVYYLYTFILVHFLLPFLAIWVFSIRFLQIDPAFRLMGGLVVIWSLYTIAVGGDFMEFRFLAPIIAPLIMILLKVIFSPLLERRLQKALASALLIGTIHAIWVTLPYGMESTADLKNHLLSPRENWIGIGKRLGEYFKNSDVIISVGAAGAIPYFSRLRSVDFIGLTDPEMVKVAHPFTRVPGHRIIAPIDYLITRGVNLVVEPNNFMFERGLFLAWAQRASWSDLQYRLYFDLSQPVRGKPLTELTFLGIPIDGQYVLAAWYLQPHPFIERKAQEEGWMRVVIRR